MVTTTDIRWRPAGAPYLATCQEGFERRCGELATWSRQWQTSAMAAPAFDYYCDVHAVARSESDGITLAILPDAYTVPVVADETNPYKVGSIFHTSWGYEQTNVEYLQVVRESKASVWLAPMGSEIRDGRLWPTVTTGLTDAVKCHRKGKHGVSVTLDYVRTAWPYKGGGCYDTRAAGLAGH